MRKVLGNDNALFFTSLWKHMLVHTLILQNFIYFHDSRFQQRENIRHNFSSTDGINPIQQFADPLP